MSVTNKRLYNIKSKFTGRKIMHGNDWDIRFGENDLILKDGLTFDTIFAGRFGYFDTGEDKISDFIGQESDKGAYNRI